MKKLKGIIEFVLILMDKYQSFIRFAIVGCVNTINYYVIYLLLMYIGFEYLWSHSTGFLISMIGSFYLNCYYTYKVKPTWKKFFQFPLTYVVNYSISTLSLFIIVDFLHMNEFLAPAISLLLPIPFTYLVSKMVLAK